MFDLYCRPVYEMQLLLDFHASVSISECHFYGNGVACMTSEETIRVVEGISNVDLVANPPRMYSLTANLKNAGKVTAMTIIPPLQSRSGFLEVILGTSNSTAVVVHEHGDETITEDQVLQTSISAPIIKLSVSPNGRFIACYRKDGFLTVMASNFSAKVIDFDTQSASKPVAIEWCGKDSVVMQWRNTGLVMVGPFGDWLNFPYDSAGVHIVPETDCCRIITSTSCEILQLVPQPTIAALEIGSMEPAALILDAMDAFEGGDPKADEHIRTIAAAKQLQGAVQTCIEAASAEFDPAQQQRLLKAASYAKAFCPDLDPSDFVETAKKLRVLNEVRKPEIGLPLTVQQYNRLTAEVLVGRLTSRKKHFLALKICDLLKLKNDRILMDWACEKVKQMATSSQSYSDEEINRTIKNQLEPYGRISYLRVAKVAYKIGRPRLATIVLDKEQHPGAQIPVLLEMNEEELALQKAINSGDYDLIYFTLVHLEGRVRPNHPASLDNFFRIVLLYPEAANLLRIYYRNKLSAQDRSPLHKLLVYGKNYQEAGNAAVNQALQQAGFDLRLSILKEASSLYAQGKDSAFFRTITDEQVELLETQKAFERRAQPRREFANLSLHETLQVLIEIGQDDRTGENRWTESELQKLVKRFKVSDKTVYHLKIQCFCQRGDWAGLGRFAAERKPPVGFRPFAVSALKYGAPDSDIERYVDKVSVPEDKFELYMEMRAYQRAADVAFKLKDEDRLREVSRACNDNVLERQIGEMIGRL
jgi:hypothetical protein